MTQSLPRPIRRHEVDAYVRDGFVVLREVLSPDWLEPLVDGCRRVLASARVRDVTRQTMSRQEPTAEGRMATRRGHFYIAYNVWRTEPAFRDFALSGALGQIACALLSSPSARLCDDLLLVKEPGCDEATEWHDDEPYSVARGSQRCSLWIPLDDVTKESGALCFIRHSHTRFSGWRERADAATLAAEHSGDVAVCDARRGDIVAHYPSTIHSAFPNRTARYRRAFAPRLAGEDARFVLPPVRGESKASYGLEEGEPLGGPLFPLAWPTSECRPQ